MEKAIFPKEDIREILLIRSAPIEQVNSLLKDLRTKFPQANITIMVQPEVSGQFPGVDDTILYRERGFGILKGLKHLSQIRRKRYDLVVVPYNTPMGVGCSNVEFFSLLVKTSYRIGYDMEGYAYHLSWSFYLAKLLLPLRLFIDIGILGFIVIGRSSSRQTNIRKKRPHIGIDARGLSYGTGIQRYIYNLIKNLPLEGDEFSYTVFKDTQRDLFSCLNLREKMIKIPKYHWQEQVMFPSKLLSQGIDLFWGANFITPLIRPCKSIITIYDLSFLRFYDQPFQQAEKRWVPLSAKTADRIIVISESTKRDVVRSLHIPEDKIRVVYPGIDHGTYRVIENTKLIASIRDRHNLPDQYILSIGSAGTRKNYMGTIEAYHQLKREGVSCKLVLVGKKTFFPLEVFTVIGDLGLKDDVLFTGYVAEEDLPILYNGAELFVYPSFFEGFGLPVLEAMACGVPVVTSNTSSLPEVAGDAAILVDPNNIEELACAMNRVLAHDSLRAEMRERGLRQAACFSWKRCAKETLEVYKEVLE